MNEIKQFINPTNLHLLKNTLLKKNNTLISLGPNCFVKEFIKFLNIDQETHFFDYIGSTLWSLCDLIENDFKDLFKYSDYKNMHVLKNSHIYSNEKYYLNFKHDFPQKHEGGEIRINAPFFLQFEQKYKRRILRLKNLLESGAPLLFIRTDLNSNRVKNQIYKEKDENGSEIDYFKKLIQLIKKKYPKSNCTFIFLTKHIEENTFFENEKLLYIKASKQIEVYETCKIDIFIELFKNIEFLKKYL
jgi:hypothetical protein